MAAASGIADGREASADGSAELDAGASKAPREAPTHVDCVCNGLRATLDVRRMVMLLRDGRVMSGNEFERAAGKASAKKWKVR